MEKKNVAAEDFEHIAWRGRMRIIMGLAYCIQHMHELSPPVVHPDLQSSSILLSEDGAAKVHTPIQLHILLPEFYQNLNPLVDKLNNHAV